MNDNGPGRDSAARAAALDVARSFIVQAPAGSGKTGLLIQRYLALLAQVERPEAIVAMTFTRKATGEIRERILRALRDAEGPQPADAHLALTWRLARAAAARDVALGWNLMAHPARLQVHTIDALCLALMRQAPLTTKLGAVPRPVERAGSLYAEAVLAALEEGGAQQSAWRCLLEHLDNDAERLLGLIAGMLAKREQWLRHLITNDRVRLRAALEGALAAEVETALGALHGLLPREMLERLGALARYAAEHLAAAGAAHPLAAHADREQPAAPSVPGLAYWQAIAGWLLSGEGTLLRQFNKAQGFPPRGSVRDPGHVERSARKRAMEDLIAELAAMPGLVAALNTVRALPPPRYEDAAWSFIDALLEILPRCAARLRLVFAQHGTIDFAEATLVALAALANEDGASDLLLAVDMRLEHLLVDEFQDTSLAQDDLIEHLTAGWASGDGRTLFIVGDPMQSIYRFRDASVSLFLDAQRQRGIGGVALEPLTLSSNFRSQRGLVEWINRAFPHVLPPRDEPLRGAVAFKPAQAARRECVEPAVTLDLALDAPGEASAALARIQAALATDAEEIAVLVRKRSDLAQLLPALRAAEIAYAAVELDRLSERQAILDLVALTHALIQPADRAAWLAVLRAPWCGLTLPDLFVLIEDCGNDPLVEAVSGALAGRVRSRLSAEGRIRLERFVAAVAPALRDRGRAPLATMVRGVWLALGGPACAAEAVDLVAAERVFALLAEHAVGADVPDWPAFCAALEALHVEPEIDTATRVQIMTLHRAKGLEFDVVVIPGLACRPRHSEPQLLLWRERPAGLLLAPMRARTAPRSQDDPVYRYLRSLAADEDDSELRRLLYVGCTRARRSLHLTATADLHREVDGNMHWKKPVRGTLLAALWPALTADVPAAPRAPTIAPLVSQRTGVPLLRLPRMWQLPPPPPGVPMLSQPAARDESESVEFDWVRETARLIGTVAHRLLRQVADEGIARWSAERVAAQRGRVEREFATLGFTGAESRSAVQQVLAAVQGTLEDPRGRWLFDPAHADAHSEHALTQWRDGAFAHRVLDRSFVDAEGTRWIVDFKLSRHEGAGREVFLDRELERYRAQLEDYAALMRALDDRPIRLGLYFPLLAGWREWPAASRG
jgi:ATP-dependent exoDNAse (exonuclease V) beta subunit